MSERLLVADCLTHHFATAPHQFELATDVAETSDPSVPTVCILDVGRKHHSSPEISQVLGRMRHISPTARILVLSSQSDVWEASDWLNLGAHGFFPAKSSSELLTAAAIVVAAGGIFIPENLTKELLALRATGSHDD